MAIFFLISEIVAAALMVGFIGLMFYFAVNEEVGGLVIGLFFLFFNTGYIVVSFGKQFIPTLVFDLIVVGIGLFFLVDYIICRFADTKPGSYYDSADPENPYY